MTVLQLCDLFFVDFHSVLQIFELKNLQFELNNIKKAYAQVKASPTSLNSAQQDAQALENFLSSFQADHCDGAISSSASFASLTARMWPSYDAQLVRLEVFDYMMAFERRRVMMATAAAWYWLMEDCASKIFSYAQDADNGLESENEGSDWLRDLTLRVFHILTALDPQRQQLCAKEFLPGLPDPTITFTVNPRAFPGEQLAERVRDHVISILRTWLKFPPNTQWVAARFVMEIVLAFYNPDALLLPGVWDVFKHVKARLLNARKQRASRMHPNLLRPFIDALRALPLGQVDSREYQTLASISTIIDENTPEASAAVSALLDSIFSFYVEPIDIFGLQISESGSHEQEQDPILMFSPPPQSGIAHTADLPPAILQIVQFVEELIPLAYNKPPTTPLQKLVAKNRDFYLPFRELGPSRRCFSSQIDIRHPKSPGAFASYALTRALLFNSPVLKQQNTFVHFRSIKHWEDFLQSQGYDENDENKAKQIFNNRCYGQVQHQRAKYGPKNVHTYFTSEEEWCKKLDEMEGTPWDFYSFYKWATGKRGTGNLAKSRMYLVGHLVGYLLAADLSYSSNIITTPTCADIAKVITEPRTSFGSLKCLIQEELVNSEAPQAAEVAMRMEQILGALQSRLSQADRAQIVLDPIMIEHTLCKFQRVKRKIGGKDQKEGKGGKGGKGAKAAKGKGEKGGKVAKGHGD